MSEKLTKRESPPPMRPDLQALRERVERASGADGQTALLELSRDIWQAVTGECLHHEIVSYLSDDKSGDVELKHNCARCGAEDIRRQPVSFVAGSIDAALSLVERELPGARYNLTTFTGLGALAILYLPGARDDGSQDVTASALTVPLAILAALLTALLRALSAGEGAGT